MRVNCDVLGCEESATGQYLGLEEHRHSEFRVCTAHFARIEGGQRPKMAAQSVDLAKPDGRPALFIGY